MWQEREGGREKQVRRTQVGKQGRKWGIITTKDLWEIWLGNYLWTSYILLFIQKKKRFNRNYPSAGIRIFPEAIDSYKEAMPSVNSPLKLLKSGWIRDPLPKISCCHVQHPWEYNNKTCLRKTLHTVVTGHEASPLLASLPSTTGQLREKGSQQSRPAMNPEYNNHWHAC